MLRVVDNGIGIAPSNVGQVFDVFTQVDATAARASGGLGLGLTVVRRILELHGGRIDVRSAGLGLGSEFVARLPLISAQRLTEPEPARIPAASEARTRHRVLIVDDNLDSSSLMAVVFEHWGHEVQTAENGTRALELLKSFSPDVAYVDIGLPDIDGYEVARRSRATPDLKSVRLVALTGYGTAVDRQRALDAGFDEHLVKPVDADILAQALAAA